MQRKKCKCVVFLALSVVCAAGAALWVLLLFFVSDHVVEPMCYKLGLRWLERGVGQFAWLSLWLPNPVNPFAYLTVFFFVKGFVPGKRKALKASVLICGVLLGAYIAMVAFLKVDFVSVLPIQIACGLAPVLTAFGIMLFYGGKKWRKVLCAVLASLALCASTWTLINGNLYNTRTTIGYSQSPKGTHQIIILACPSNPSWFGRDNWTSYVACPMYGLWYKQDNPEYVNPDVLQNIVWLDEHTAQFNDRNNYPRTITFR